MESVIDGSNPPSLRREARELVGRHDFEISSAKSLQGRKVTSKLKHSVTERFWKKVDKSGDCWIWNGYCAPNGYGQFRPISRQRGGKLVMAHVFSYREAFGDFESGLFVCHRCDNPPCVKPDHLFVGTSLENTRDMIEKGRQNPPHGYLDSDLVRRVMEMNASGVPQTEIANVIGTLRQTVWKIVHGVIGNHMER